MKIKVSSGEKVFGSKGPHKQESFTSILSGGMGQNSRKLCEQLVFDQ